MNHQQTHVPTKPLTFHAGWQNDIGDEFSPLASARILAILLLLHLPHFPRDLSPSHVK